MSEHRWDERAELYRTSATHATGDDLDAVVELCNPHAGVKVLDVATGGGHVARRLREQGAEVVTGRRVAGDAAGRRLRPPRICRSRTARSTSSSRRIAAHHFDDLGQAVGEMARVSNRVVVIEDMLYRTEEEQEAEKLRDPTPRPSLAADEWRDLLVDAGLEVEQELYFSKTHDFDEWLARTGCEGADAERVRELLAPFTSDDGSTWSNDYIVVKATEVAELDGDHRRQRHAARRLRPDGLGGTLPRSAQPRLRDEPRRGRHAGQGRPGRRGRSGLRHGRGRGARGRARTRR